MAKLIFIAGSGRSGTHLVGRTIASHRDVQPRIETPFTFKLLTYLATHQDWDRKLRLAIAENVLMASYRVIAAFSSKPFVMEKAHPSLWLAERIFKVFPDSRFIGVWREAEATVASMLRHGGVLSWYERLPQTVENRFLGITKSNLRKFSKMQLEEKCTHRWISHKREIDRLSQLYPEKFLSVKYDDLLTNRGRILDEISRFLNIDNDFAIEELSMGSLDKWRTHLDLDQIKVVQETIWDSAPDLCKTI